MDDNKRKKASNLTSARQLEKFKEAAREAGCDESENAFDEIVKKVAKAPPPRQAEKKSKPT